jgi:hypothetical protein
VDSDYAGDKDDLSRHQGWLSSSEEQSIEDPGSRSQPLSRPQTRSIMHLAPLV